MTAAEEGRRVPDHEVRDSIGATAAAWSEFVAATTISPEESGAAALRYEKAVRRTGELIAAQVDAEVHDALREAAGDLAAGEATARVLARYRAYGSAIPKLHHATLEAPRAAVAKASTVFPDDWVAASDAGELMVVVEASGRAHYTPSATHTVAAFEDQIYPIRPYNLAAHHRDDLPPPRLSAVVAGRDLGMSGDDFAWVAVQDTDGWRWRVRARRTTSITTPRMAIPVAYSGRDGERRARAAAIHELAHRIEAHNQRIPVACKTFRHRRTAENGHPPEPTELLPGAWGHPDQFAHSYVGRLYAGSHTEVLSMGMEAVFAGSFGGLIGRCGFAADPEHRHLVLGLCATA